jgi:hypothetical protein
VREAALKTNPAVVLRDAVIAHKVDTDVIAAKVKQKFAAKEKAKKTALSASTSTKKAAQTNHITIREGGIAAPHFFTCKNRQEHVPFPPLQPLFARLALPTPLPQGVQFLLLGFLPPRSEQATHVNQTNRDASFEILDVAVKSEGYKVHLY